MGDVATIDQKQVDSVVAELAALFGPGHSNGVVAILSHPDLPDHFDKSQWTDWTFRPADAAFDKAHDLGLIVPWKLSGKWAFTDLGQALRAHFAEEQSA